MGIRLFACGDVVNFTGNKNWLCPDLLALINDSDYSVCNFEAPLVREGMAATSKVGPHIYQSKDSIRYLAEAGFTHVAIANNHIYDFGDSALMNTINNLESRGIDFFGAGCTFEQAYRYTIIKKNGVSVGLLAACENEFGCYYEEGLNRAGYAWLFHSLLEDRIIELANKVDYVVLFAHAGIEDIPIPIKEWRDRYKRLCDIGVDVIVGHHPHVPQGYEFYNGKIIFYSLGNFYFDIPSSQNNSDDSFSVILNFFKNKFEFGIVYHKKISGVTSLVEASDVSFDVDKLNVMLEEGYMELNNKFSLELFDAYYNNYYLTAAGAYKNIISFIIDGVKRVLGKAPTEKFKGLLLLHNIRIDSHRFIVQRALSLKYEKK